MEANDRCAEHTRKLLERRAALERQYRQEMEGWNWIYLEQHAAKDGEVAVPWTAPLPSQRTPRPEHSGEHDGCWRTVLEQIAREHGFRYQIREVKGVPGLEQLWLVRPRPTAPGE